MDKFILSNKKKPGKVIILTSPGSFSVVRLIGLEPTRPEPPDPKSGASTNSATSAFSVVSLLLCKRGCKVTNFSLFHQKFTRKFYQCVPSTCKILVFESDMMVWIDAELRVLSVSVIHRTSREPHCPPVG